MRTRYASTPDSPRAAQALPVARLHAIHYPPCRPTCLHELPIAMTLPAMQKFAHSASLIFSLALPLCLAAPRVARAGGLSESPPVAAPASAPASTASEPEQQGIETLEYDPNAPDIQAAVKKARQALPEFFKAIRTPSSQIANIAVKIEVREGQVREYVWVMPFNAVDKGFEGQVNDIPRKVRSVVTGQKVEFTQKDIVDWAYSDLHAHRMHGNYTTCVPLLKAPAEERQTLKRVYGLDCDKH